MKDIIVSNMQAESSDKNEIHARLLPDQINDKYNDVIKKIGFGYYQYKILGSVALMNMSSGVFAALMPFLIPFYKKDIFINEWDIGLLISSQGFGSLVGSLFFSFLSDICGRKVSLILALLSCIVFSSL